MVLSSLNTRLRNLETGAQREFKADTDLADFTLFTHESTTVPCESLNGLWYN